MTTQDILTKLENGTFRNGYELKGNFVYITFMGKKRREGKNGFCKKWLKIEQESIAMINTIKAIKILKRIGYTFPNSNGDSFYFKNSKNEQIRISNHQKLAYNHNCADVQIYSCEQKGYKEIVKKFLKNL
jgi:hypothetical protein